MLVKICGIKTLADAQTAIEAGADFLGFNFVPTSKRLVSAETAREIILGLGNTKPRLVGIFQNESKDRVNNMAKTLGLDYVQLHGEETPDYCVHMTKPVIKVFSVDADFDIDAIASELRKYRVDFYMLDRKNREGEVLNREKVTNLAKSFPIILAGGLTPENAHAIIQASGHIIGVDVAGGVETDGVKDAQKIKAFIAQIK
ncbi:MAG: N-(5'-phosphoribosyl)anthranilate isomerase [Candidatus Taylorbacteria bacterium CG11_big_fil_rev_8_21_14_0_20_46_11]|uniref:N-(5'-phosphoribosyl)anthranilate isomerase n=1 Tax=Candidatus Taylorbacteria bacterium CG11_big_fil_rev_8_21_14_0_20_46_11 TaxID=1975025 RepID=A0A2H0KD58_9BACT|nr:MAG: N-(5'-phosphoribosyl)anthranilate isomerase [Candidatus Taylorbacteria bacterium CG11_big_fil_rev_8_21_14_0_20_46_11]